jgi:hypothetical protein
MKILYAIGLAAAMKSAVGIGGRCTPAEAVKDSAQRAVQ